MNCSRINPAPDQRVSVITIIDTGTSNNIHQTLRSSHYEVGEKQGESCLTILF